MLQNLSFVADPSELYRNNITASSVLEVICPDGKDDWRGLPHDLLNRNRLNQSPRHLSTCVKASFIFFVLPFSLLFDVRSTLITATHLRRTAELMLSFPLFPPHV